MVFPAITTLVQAKNAVPDKGKVAGRDLNHYRPISLCLPATAIVAVDDEKRRERSGGQLRKVKNAKWIKDHIGAGAQDHGRELV
jgi:hypothetical protein